MKKILVVDDQVGIRLLLKEVFKQEGYGVVLAMNGEEALKKMNKQIPDLIILDYQLPIMDGYTFVMKIKEMGLDIPTVIMSGLPDRAEEKAKEMQMVKKIIGKPFQLNDIRAIVRELLQ